MSASVLTLAFTGSVYAHSRSKRVRKLFQHRISIQRAIFIHQRGESTFSSRSKKRYSSSCIQAIKYITRTRTIRSTHYCEFSHKRESIRIIKYIHEYLPISIRERHRALLREYITPRIYSRAVHWKRRRLISRGSGGTSSTY